MNIKIIKKKKKWNQLHIPLTTIQSSYFYKNLKPWALASCRPKSNNVSPIKSGLVESQQTWIQQP